MRQKRSKSQITRDRRRIAELALQGYSQRKISDILEYETGTKISRQQVANDLVQIRKEWRKEMVTDYNLLMNQELERCDILENELWEAWKKSTRDIERKITEEVAKLIDDADSAGGEKEYDMIVSKITTIADNNQMNPNILNQILQVQKERRKLLGLYAPSKVGINLYSEQVVRVKGYAPTASPDHVWPSLEDGIEDGDYEEE